MFLGNPAPPHEPRSGKAEGDKGERFMRPGDWILIPSRQRHRVARTATGEPTVWLAVHYAE